MKKLLISICLFSAFSASAQFQNVDSLRIFINKYLRNSAIDAFTNLRLNTAMNGLVNFVDSAYRASPASKIDSVKLSQDSILLNYRGGSVVRRDTIHTSISGTGSPNSNVGSGYSFAIPGTNNVKRLQPNVGSFIYLDSTSTANTIKLVFDTANAFAYLRATMPSGGTTDTIPLSTRITTVNNSKADTLKRKNDSTLTIVINGRSTDITGIRGTPGKIQVDTSTYLRVGGIFGDSLWMTAVPGGGGSGPVYWYANTDSLKLYKPSDGSIGYTNRYNDANKGGAARYVFVAGSTATGNNSTILTPTAGGTGRWFIYPQNNEVIARQAGIFPSTDNTAGLAALNAYTSANRIWLTIDTFPYVIDPAANMDLTSHMHWRYRGVPTTQYHLVGKSYSGHGKNFFTHSGTGTDSTKDVIFDGLNFDNGQRFSATHGFAAGSPVDSGSNIIYVQLGDSITVNNCKFKGTTNAGILCYNVQHQRFTNLVGDSMGRHMYTNTGDTSSHNLYFDNIVSDIGMRDHYDGGNVGAGIAHLREGDDVLFIGHQDLILTNSYFGNKYKMRWYSMELFGGPAINNNVKIDNITLDGGGLNSNGFSLGGAVVGTSEFMPNGISVTNIHEQNMTMDLPRAIDSIGGLAKYTNLNQIEIGAGYNLSLSGKLQNVHFIIGNQNINTTLDVSVDNSLSKSDSNYSGTTNLFDVGSGNASGHDTVRNLQILNRGITIRQGRLFKYHGGAGFIDGVTLKGGTVNATKDVSIGEYVQPTSVTQHRGIAINGTTFTASGAGSYVTGFYTVDALGTAKIDFTGNDVSKATGLDTNNIQINEGSPPTYYPITITKEGTNFLTGGVFTTHVRTVNGTIPDASGNVTVSGGGSPANPTASAGRTPVNGSATTFMRSDAAPPVDTSIIQDRAKKNVSNGYAGIDSVAKVALINMQTGTPGKNVINANAAPYYAKPNDTTYDNASAIEKAIQAAYDTAVTLGTYVGFVEFDDGEYIVLRNLIHASNAGVSGYNCQIPLPFKSNAAPGGYVSIIIRPKVSRDYVTPVQTYYGNIKVGVSFRSKLTSQSYSSTYGWPAMFGGTDPQQGQTYPTNYSFVGIKFQDVTFKLPENPTLACIQDNLITRMTYDGVTGTIFKNNPVAPTVEPTNPLGIFNFGPAYNNNGYFLKGNLLFIGLYAGIAVAEHMNHDGFISVTECEVGLKISSPPWSGGKGFFHAAQLNVVSIEGTKVFIAATDENGIRAISGANADYTSSYNKIAIDIKQLDYELGGTASWNASYPTYFLYDPNDVVAGNIYYHKVMAFHGVVSPDSFPPVVLGGTSAKITNLLSNQNAVSTIPITVLSDTYTRANSTTTAGNLETPSSLAWTTSTGTWGISSNKLYVQSAVSTGATTTNKIYADAGRSDFTYSIDITPGTSGFANQILYRYVDASNYMFLDVSTGGLNVYKKVAGSFTQLATEVYTFTAGVTHTIKIVASGSVQRFYVDNVLIPALNTTESFNSTATIEGVAVISGSGFSNNTDRFDNFLVTYDSAATANLTLTTIGTTGAASYDPSSKVLNVPQYTSGGTVTLQDATNAGDSTTKPIILLSSSGTNRDAKLYNPNSGADGYGVLYFKNRNGTNTSPVLTLSPNGTGASSTYKSAFNLYNTDEAAALTGEEFLQIKSSGTTGYLLNSVGNGTGSIRPIDFQMGGVSKFKIGTTGTITSSGMPAGTGTPNVVVHLNDSTWGQMPYPSGGSGTDSADVAGYGINITKASTVRTFKVDTATIIANALGSLAVVNNTNYTVPIGTSAVYFVYSSGGTQLTITLPNPSSVPNREIKIAINGSSVNIAFTTVSGTSGFFVGGTTSVGTSTATNISKTFTYKSNGTDWYLIN